MHIYLITYDIAQDKRRFQVADMLQNYGKRVQYSVFEIWINDRDYVTLMDHMANIIDEREDSIRVYALCQSCAGRVTVMGTGDGPAPPGVLIL